jgi:hypothetical protein
MGPSGSDQMRRSIALVSKGDAHEDNRMNVVALVVGSAKGKNSICFGTTDLYRIKVWAYFKAECWVHPVDYLSEHMNGDGIEKMILISQYIFSQHVWSGTEYHDKGRRRG